MLCGVVVPWISTSHTPGELKHMVFVCIRGLLWAQAEGGEQTAASMNQRNMRPECLLLCPLHRLEDTTELIVYNGFQLRLVFQFRILCCP